MRYTPHTHPTHSWTPEDDALIRDLYPQGHFTEICEKLNISQDNLKSRACWLKVISPKRQLEIKNAALLKDGLIECNRCHTVRPVEDYYVNTHYGTFDHTCRICRCAGSVSTLEARLARLPACKTGPLTVEQARAKWVAQAGRCAYSGVPMVFETRSPSLLTVDRIDSEVGYTDENTVLCCYRVNMMKHIQPKAEFIDWCKRIAAHCKT